jgi:type IV pilus assembly protein PilW
MSHSGTRSRSRSLGFSLVEIMVAALIGLVGSVVIFQVFAVSENQKRTTTGGSDASQSGLLALYSIEREARLAGYGINYLPLLGCSVLGYDAGPPERNPMPAFNLVAAEITDGAAGVPDVIKFVYSDSSLVMAPVRLTSASNAGTTLHKVALRFGFNTGDLIIVGRAGSPGTKCTLQQITDVPDTPVENIEHEEGVRYNKDSIATQPNYPSWSNTTQEGGILYSLGPAPSVSLYRVENGRQLTHQNLLLGDATTVVMDGIVQLQAEYGKDTTAMADGTVDVYNTTAPANFDEWSRVLALRVAVLARSSEYDKTHCAANPRWTSGAGATNFVMTNADGTADSGAACAPGAAPGTPDPNNWRQYRYRVFETVVPLRNLIWFPL